MVPENIHTHLPHRVFASLTPHPSGFSVREGFMEIVDVFTDVIKIQFFSKTTMEIVDVFADALKCSN